MKRLIALVSVLASLAFAGTAQASTTDSCVDFGSGQNNCFATTSEDNVDFAQVTMGKYSFGTYTLVCQDHWGNRYVKQGNILKGGRRSFFPEALFGLRSPDCVLSAHANTVNSRTARVTVTLID
jgi:hypothetical protein